MSEVTAVPLRPIAKGSLTKLWIGIGAVVLVAVAGAWTATSKQVAMAMPAGDFLARNAKRAGVVTTPSGLQYEVLAPGHGPHATSSDIVIVDYDGKLANGETFDASSRHGGPATLPVSGLIPGWVEGLQLMNVGSHYRFWIPPELGYGPAGAGDGVIPPNALLVFDVTLHGIQPGSAGVGGMGGMGGADMGGSPHGGM
ncbi:MAG: FKBP-type peptidyl-prolyl cis-trans isomerase [Sphingomonadaceae bacterium]|nr:FKBP-type peptidyl-prolyl cis-trans isomerase [Sphingomonadaceae bacterium]